MVRVAALYDIHANLPALEAVLSEIRREKVDQIVVGGDVLPGPMPHETLACLLTLNIPTTFISGNGDRVVLAQRRGIESEEVPEQFRDIIRWNAKQLSPEHERVVASWPLTLTNEIEHLGDVLFCHATPRNDTDVFTRLTPEDRLAPLFGNVEASVIVCGHTHMQFDRMVGRTRVMNAGSIGMPFQQPGAYWLLLGPDIQFRNTPYDLTKAAERIRGTKYPQAEDFAAHNVLQPPSEAQMLEAFTKMSMS